MVFEHFCSMTAGIGCLFIKVIFHTASAFIQKQIFELTEHSDIGWRRGCGAWTQRGWSWIKSINEQPRTPWRPQHRRTEADTAPAMEEKGSAGQTLPAHCPAQPCPTVPEAHARMVSRAWGPLALRLLDTPMNVEWCGKSDRTWTGPERNSEQNSCFLFLLFLSHDFHNLWNPQQKDYVKRFVQEFPSWHSGNKSN